MSNLKNISFRIKFQSNNFTYRTAIGRLLEWIDTDQRCFCFNIRTTNQRIIVVDVADAIAEGTLRWINNVEGRPCRIQAVASQPETCVCDVIVFRICILDIDKDQPHFSGS